MKYIFRQFGKLAERPQRRSRKSRKDGSLGTFERLEDRSMLANVIPVPFNADNVAIPHAAHEDGRITLKAIVRDADPAHAYRVQWDVDRDGNFDEEFSRTYTPLANGEIRDIGRTFQAPFVSADMRFDITARVKDLTTSEDSFGTFKLFIYNFTPGLPSTWTGEVLDVIQIMTTQEALWHAHRQITELSGVGSSIAGRAATDTFGESASLMLQLFSDSGHLPAYAPGSVNTFGVNLPSGFLNANDQRWGVDPYAETTIRLLNSVLSKLQTAAISSIDEGNTSGYFGTTEIARQRIAGTTDGLGLRFSSRSGPTAIAPIADQESAPATAYALRGIVSSLAALRGTPAQVGQSGVSSMKIEFIVQQLVDWLSFVQSDTDGQNIHLGGFPATDSNNLFNTTTARGTGAAVMGLQLAEVIGNAVGVIVTNRVKGRLAQYLVNNRNVDGSFNYFSSTTGGLTNNFLATASALIGFRWLGANNLPNNGSISFPGHSTVTNSQLLVSHDLTVSFLNSRWDIINNSGTFASNLWFSPSQPGYLQGNNTLRYTNGSLSQAEAFNLFLLSQSMKTGAPTPSLIGAHDWRKEIGTYFARSQFSDLETSGSSSNYSVFGQIDADVAAIISNASVGGAALNATLLGGIASIGNPLGPVASIQSSASIVNVGASVILDASSSFHFDPNARILTYQWDFNSIDGLWWETGATPDSTGITTTTQFGQLAAYTITLRVLDNGSPARSDVSEYFITVNHAPTSISLSSNSIAENAGSDAIVGNLSFTDPDPGDTGSFSLPAGVGDNLLFNIAPDGTTLRANSDFNFEAQNSYSVTLRVTDLGGLSFDKQFTISLANVNEAPTSVSISSSSIAENLAAGAIVGEFATTDPDVSDVSFTYSFVSGTNDNSLFSFNVNQLVVNNSLDFESKSSYTIQIRSSDSQGLFLDQTFTISVIDVPELVGLPMINDGSIQRSLIRQLVLTFDGTLTIDPGAFKVEKLGSGGGMVTTSYAMPILNALGQTVVTLVFSGAFTNGYGALVDGNYQLTIDGTKINRNNVQGASSIFGNEFNDKFFALYGDSDGDGEVGTADVLRARRAFGTRLGDASYNAAFDFDGNFEIGTADLLRVRKAFGRTRLPF